MSIKTEIASLNANQEELEARLKDVERRLADRYKEKINLESKLKAFNERSSELAKLLAIDVAEGLEDCIGIIESFEEEKREYETKLDDIHCKLSERCDDTTLYVTQEVERMMAEVFAYIEREMCNIGYDLKRTFAIQSVVKKEIRCADTFDAVTGDIMIFDHSSGTSITQTQDFHFEKNLYDFKRDDYGFAYGRTTDWYNNYFENFTNIFMDKLSRDFKFGSSFKLTIQKHTFTLELV